ncbi:MAG: D-alanine--D-alanine ligase [Lachnospiraceae bacterium]|nr:D-alanine--D-alanine ligase [Lachnospiraceae bacterium]
MKVVVLCGGISTERDVSLVSGMQVYKALKGKGHQAIMLDVYLGYSGSIDDIFEKKIDWDEMTKGITADAPDIEAVKRIRKGDPEVFFGENVIEICRKADIVFMGLHGDCGENGRVQAAFDLYNIKYTGTDYASSAMAMDKSVTKKLFEADGIPTPASVTLSKGDEYKPEYPCVVKVCSGGSSIGVYMVNNDAEYKNALDEAFCYDGKVLVEQFIKGREFTDGVFDGKPLPVVEIAPKEGFYDYKNKYQEGSTIETCPAEITDEQTKTIQEIALKAYNALGIKTYARMDFMMDEKTGKFYCLEANTLPGMTPMSLIPQEAKAIGIEFPELCEKIIEVSLKKYK